MSMAVVPPKLDGQNCLLVALCHAANYFHIIPPRIGWERYSQLITPAGIEGANNAVDLAVKFLPGLEITIIASPDDAIEGRDDVTVIYSTGNEKFEVIGEATIVAWHNGNGRGHAEFFVDRHDYPDGISYLICFHQPGAIRM
jgi:hypothetical protein